MTNSPINHARKIPYKNQLFLFVVSGGRCEFNGCNRYLIEHPLTLAKGNYAQEAHIVAFKEAGPRGDTFPRPDDINAVENLMLLCPTCHKLIDDNKEQFTVTTLKKHKRDHEERIKHLTGLSPDLKTYILQVKGRINGQPVDIPVEHVTEAVAPRYPSDMRGRVIDLTAISDNDPNYYQVAARTIKREIEQLYAPGMDVDRTRHISLFALGPIPVLVYLGSQLSNKIPTDLYQRHRGEIENWIWKETGSPIEYEFKTRKTGKDKSCVALLLSLSGQIHSESLPKEIDERFSVYEITLKNKVPDPTFLRLRQDLDNFKMIYQSSLRKILQDHGVLKAIHLFPAIPAPVAVLCGRELLPKVDPTIWVYDNNNKKHDGFTFCIRINEQ